MSTTLAETQVQIDTPRTEAPSKSERPRLGCAVIVKDGEKILLGVRAKEPFRGKWVIPGGGVKFLEGFRETAKREIREEVGIEIEVQEMLDLYEIVNPPDEHRVIIYCLAKYKDGEVRPSSDLSEARFLSKAEVSSLVSQNAVTPTVVKVLSDLHWI